MKAIEYVPYGGRVVTRDKARSLGLKRFFTKVPCKNGHISERDVTYGRCVACERAKDAKLWAKIRAEKPKTFICRGKKLPVRCKDCSKARTAERQKITSAILRAKPENREKQRQRNKEFYDKNQEEQKERAQQYRKENPEKHKAATMAWRDANKERHKEMTAEIIAMLIFKMAKVHHPNIASVRVFENPDCWAEFDGN